MEFTQITTVEKLRNALALLEVSFDAAATNPADPFRVRAAREVGALYQQMRNLPTIEMSRKLTYYLHLLQQAKTSKVPFDWEKAENVEEELRRAGKREGKRKAEEKCEGEEPKKVSLPIYSLKWPETTEFRQRRLYSRPQLMEQAR